MDFEIWLGTHYSHFDHGIAHLQDGSTVPLLEWIHTATYGRDTLLLDRADRLLDVDYPLRWYIEESGLSFYNWDAEIERIIFYIESGKDLEVSEFGTLRAGGSCEME